MSLRPETTDIEGFVTVTQTARELGLAPQTIQARLKRGAMRGVLVHPRLWLIPKSEVERWRQLGKQKPGPKPRQPYTQERPS